MNNAPVAIPVFDRPNHFRNCIESLKKNLGAEDTTLYISSDGPRCDKSKILVGQVRDYIKTIHGFKNVIVFTPKENTSKQVWFETRQRVINDNDRFIVTEDDNVFSTFFLDFINQGLEIYEDVPRVAAICGYNYPGFPSYKAEAISMKCFAAWGYGTWRDKDLLSDADMQSVALNVFSDRKLFSEINAALPHMALMMQNVSKGNLIAGDVAACSLLFKHDRVCIFPSISLVRNMGCDGSGEHCVINDRYDTQAISDRPIAFGNLQTLQPASEHTKWLKAYFGGKSSELINWQLYWEENADSLIIRWILKLAFGVISLPLRTSRLAYRVLRRIFI